MTNKFMWLVIIACILASCNNETKITGNMAPAAPEKVSEKESGIACYLGVNKKDTITLHINVVENVVTGDLAYYTFEKDKNTGNINGIMKGDTLIAQYSFMSEGTNSIREVAFLQKGNDLVEGYGEMEEKNGKMIFKNNAVLNFDNKPILIKVDCKGK